MPDEGPPVAAELTMFVPDWNIMGPGLMRSVSGGENTSVVSCYCGDVTLVWILFLVCHNCEASGYEWTHIKYCRFTHPISAVVSSKV